MNSQAKHHFNHIAQLYDEFKNRNSLYYKTLKNAVKNEIRIKKAVILDIGCATGSVLNFLDPGLGVGIDISGEMIKIATKKYAFNKQLRFEVFDIEVKPYRKRRFDYILFNDVIEHVANPKNAIANISKSMGHKTTLVLSMANPFWEPLLMFLEKMHLKMPEGPHYRIPENELNNLLSKNRLYIVSRNVYFPSLPTFSWLGLIYVYTIKKRA